MRRQLLPIECIALILEELRGDCGTLLNCALTHSTWYPHAKRVLYKTIHIGTSKAYSTFLHMISNVHLRDLLGRMEELRFSGFANDPAADKFRTLSRVLVALADLPLPRLRHLAFRSATPPSTIPIHVFPDSFFKTFSSVRCLVLEAPNLRFVGLHRLRHLVSALPQLEDFRILAVRLLILNPVNPVPSIATAHPQPRLQQLHLDFYRGWASRNRPDPETTLLYWLALTPTVQERALRVLRLGTVTSLLNEPEIYYDALAHILECLGPSLTDLQVSIDPKGTSVLSHNPNLESLTLRFDPGMDAPPLPALANTGSPLMTALATLNAPRLRKFRLDLCVVATPAFEGLDPQRQNDDMIRHMEMDWKPLDELAARKQWEATINVEYLLCGNWKPKPEKLHVERYHLQVEEELKKLAWHARGTLRLGYTIVAK